MSRLEIQAPYSGKYCLNITHTMKGVRWYIHEKDADINEPSCPHCHAVGKNWKLNIYTGQIYDAQNHRYTGEKVSKTELKKLWKQKKFVEIVLRERARYEALHLDAPVRYPKLPELKLRTKHCRRSVVVSSSWLMKNKRNYMRK